MKAAHHPIQRPRDAKLLVVDAAGMLQLAPRAELARFLIHGDLLVANDAATLPASLAGIHLRSGAPIEVRLAGRRTLAIDDLHEFSAIVFGAGDHRTRTEDRSAPPPLRAGDTLALGPLRARVLRMLGHPRLVALAFDGAPDEIWAGIARHGKPVQYAHVTEPLALWDVWTRVAALPVAFEPPSAGFVLDWRLLHALAERGVEFATLTHAAGLSSTGDPALDARLPFDEPYRLPQATVDAIERTHRRGGRVIALGTTVTRALEHAASQRHGLRAGDGLADQRLGAATSLRVVDAIVSGTHEPGTSHYELLRAFADDDVLARADAVLLANGYRTHEFGDSVLIERAARRSASSAAIESEHRDARAQVWPAMDRDAVLDSERVQDAQPVLARQHFEIGERADADVRRVVPLVGQHARHRHAARCDLKPVRPVREIGEADDAAAADTRGLAQHLLGVAQVLQRVELQHDVEALVLEQREALLEVELHDVDAALRAREHVRIVDLDAIAGALPVFAQVREELTVAATQIEHARPMRHELRDQLHVLPVRHDAPSAGESTG